MLKDQPTEHHAKLSHTYWEHITNEASLAVFNSDDEDSSLLSTEAIPEHSSLIDFKAFARDYPEKLFPLLQQLRPEFQELFIEYWLLGKSQSFIAKCHGFVQTRVWQNLRIIEQSIGSLIVLGTSPTDETIRPILKKAGVETTQYGSLARMIVLYASTQSYAKVAKEMDAPTPTIRKIFRPVIGTLLASKDMQTAAVGAYLRSLTHQASLRSTGLSKSCLARLRRIKLKRFDAPLLDSSPLISFGTSETLGNAPWYMLEISSEHRMAQLASVLQAKSKKIFGKKAAQIFAPVNAEGELTFGYIFVRAESPALVRALLHVRGIVELATVYDGDGALDYAVTISNAEVQAMIANQAEPELLVLHINDFVEILSGPAAHYCGTLIEKTAKGDIVEVKFPTGRRFLVTADPSSLTKVLPPASSSAIQNFWGI